MADDLGHRLLPTPGSTALESFAAAFGDWVMPFLQAWMTAGPQPSPGDPEIAAIRDQLDQWRSERPLPVGYEWLPEMLSRLAPAVRFNARNLVNIHPSPFVPSVLASALVSLQNPNNIVRAVSRPTWEMELECVAWMAEHLVGFAPDHAWGNVVSGGTIANLTALLVARDYCYRKLARPRPAEVRSRGLFGLPTGVVLATAGSHYSIRKALWCLGMGDENVVSIPVAYDEQVRRDARRDKTFVDGITNDRWSELISKATATEEHDGTRELQLFYAGEQQPFSLQPLNSEIFKALYGCFEYSTPLIAYIFTIGTTDTGTIERPDTDALRELEREDIFVHADAAAGGFALMHPRVRPHVKGLASVHSVTVDGHKLGHLPYPNGAILFRERGWMYGILHEAPYLRDLAPTLEGSRPGSHVAALWAAIEDLGKSGRYTAWLDQLFAYVDGLVAALAASGSFQVLHKVELTTVAIAPLAKLRESRSELNRIVDRMEQLIRADQGPTAYLVNVDRGLAGIRVRDCNVYSEPPADPAEDRLVDIWCLRIVAANPAIAQIPPGTLVSYLEHKLAEARRSVLGT